MTLKTRPVRLSLLSLLSAPLAGARINAQLSQSTPDGVVLPSHEIDGTDIVPLVVTLTEDPEKPGDYLGNFWPNTRGLKGTRWLINVAAGELLMKSLNLTVIDGSASVEVLLKVTVDAPPYPQVFPSSQVVGAAQGYAAAAGIFAGLAAASAAAANALNLDFEDIAAAAGHAAAAENSAGAAGASASLAEGAKISAEAAMSAAAAAARLVGSTALGLATTTSGQYFFVPSATSGSFSDSYLNSAGIAVYQKTLLTPRQIGLRTGVAWGVAGFGSKLPMYLTLLGDLVVKGVNISKQVAANTATLAAANVASIAATIATNVDDLVTLKGRFSTAPTIRSGVALGLAGANNKLGIFIDSAGNPWSRGKNINRRLDDCESLLQYMKYLHASRDIAMFGDSLTLGMSAYLAARFDGARGVVSYGIGGQTSDQIFARQGSVATLVTLPGNSIIAGTAPVTLSAITPKLISTGSDNTGRTITGSIVSNGVATPGTLTRTATGAWPSQIETYTWTRTTAGSAVTVDAEAVFIPDCSIGNDYKTNVFWPGRNDISTDVPLATIQASITNAVNFLKSKRKSFVLLSCLNADQEYASNTTSIAGMTVYPTQAARYAAIIALNRWMMRTYPNEYFDLRSLLVRSGTGAGQDAIDAANDVVPVSQRGDSIHLNGGGYAIAAAGINSNLTYRGL